MLSINVVNGFLEVVDVDVAVLARTPTMASSTALVTLNAQPSGLDRGNSLFPFEFSDSVPELGLRTCGSPEVGVPTPLPVRCWKAPTDSPRKAANAPVIWAMSSPVGRNVVVTSYAGGTLERIPM